MAPLTECVSSLYGAYRLARFDSRGLQYFNVGAVGFFRSFTAALFVAPFAFVNWILLPPYGQPFSKAIYAFFMLVVTYVISWCVTPFIMAGISLVLDRKHTYVRFAVAYNWSAVPQNIVYIVVVTAAVIAGFSNDTVFGLALIILLWSFIYTGFVVHRALDVPVVTASGIVLIEFLLRICIELLIIISR